MSEDFRGKLPYQGALLGLLAALASGLLALGHELTREPIETQRREELRQSLAQVIPAANHDNDLLADALELTGPDGQPRQVYRAFLGATPTGAAYKVTGYGYAGAIEIVMGVDAQGRLLGVRVLAHKETPGLGDKIEAQRDPWITRFSGLSLGDPPESEWAVKKDGGRFDQFTGATITPRGVVKAIKEGLQWFEANRAALTAAKG